jgi:hypothetical protein
VFKNKLSGPRSSVKAYLGLDKHITVLQFF